MERDYTCLACSKPFKVMNESPKPAAPEVSLGVACPHCGTSNRVTWPAGAHFAVVPK
jgi:DNA-directed RNA polymerase subunit RPC12/RpoP